MTWFEEIFEEYYTSDAPHARRTSKKLKSDFTDLSFLLFSIIYCTKLTNHGYLDISWVIEIVFNFLTNFVS
ncbi:hypothetical protein B0177_03750 [Streptococcus pseudopneumoniae]|nr:hypothetical protein B0177_03750 [Streptococcus pseudopneumoniae]